MRGSFFLRILFAVILIGALVGIGAFIYNAGVSQGLATGRSVPAPEGEGFVQPYFYPPYYRPWGFGFFGLIFPLLFVFLIFMLLVRGLFFRGWRHYGPWKGYGSREHWSQGVPPMVEEWHRKMHAEPDEQTPPQE